MKTAIIEIEDKVDKLLAVLDKDIRHIQDNLLRLNELRGFVIKRDDVSLHKLLESIQFQSNDYKKNELKRRLLREELAAALDCSFAQMTLSRLETVLSGEKKTEVTKRKIKLHTLAGKLKIEHSSTAMLLSDCSRFNSVLLKGILELGQTGTITYSSIGSAERQTNSTFMNLQF
jgi:hypothetical protein